MNSDNPGCHFTPNFAAQQSSCPSFFFVVFLPSVQRSTGPGATKGQASYVPNFAGRHADRCHPRTLFPFSPPYLRNSPNGTYLGPAMRSSRACLAAAAHHGTAPSLPQFRVSEVCGRLPGLGRGRVVGQPVVGVVGRPGGLGSRLRHPPRFSELLPIGETTSMRRLSLAGMSISMWGTSRLLACCQSLEGVNSAGQHFISARRAMVAVHLQASSARAVRTQPAASPACDSSSARVVDVVEERPERALVKCFRCRALPARSSARDKSPKMALRRPLRAMTQVNRSANPSPKLPMLSGSWSLRQVVSGSGMSPSPARQQCCQAAPCSTGKTCPAVAHNQRHNSADPSAHDLCCCSLRFMA